MSTTWSIFARAWFVPISDAVLSVVCDWNYVCVDVFNVVSSMSCNTSECVKPVSVFVYNIKHLKDINYRDFKIECQQIWQLQVTAVSVKKLNPYLILYMLDKLKIRMSQIKIFTFYISREYVSLCLTFVCVNTDGELDWSQWRKMTIVIGL